MKTTLTLRKAIWVQSTRKSVLNKVLNEQAELLESEIKKTIDDSSPSGILRPLAPITARKSSANIGFARRRGTKTRVVTGRRFYRASAPGQPPAKRTGRLYRSINVKRINNVSIIARVDVPYAEYVDSPDVLNRPFFKSVATRFFKEHFRQNVRARIRELT